MNHDEAMTRVLHRSEERIATLERDLRQMQEAYDSAQLRYWAEEARRVRVSAAAIDLLRVLNKEDSAIAPECRKLDAALAQNAAECHPKDSHKESTP